MTADIELLPLPKELQGRGKSGATKLYARANVAHATAPLQAEIEALRAEVAKQSAYAKRTHDWNTELLANNERLAEAGRRVTAAFRAHGEASSFTRQAERTRHECEAAMLSLDAALRDHDQEGGNG